MDNPEILSLSIDLNYKSELRDKEFNEHYQDSDVLLLIHNKTSAERTPKNIEFLSTIQELKSPVKYDHKGIGIGRIYSSHSLFKLPKMHRNSILKWNGYRDFDIVNCHPQILLNLCKSNEIHCFYLNNYCADRENVLKITMSSYNVSREDAKTLYAILMYGGSFNTWRDSLFLPKELKPNDFISSLSTELESISNKIVGKNPKVVKQISMKSSKTKKYKKIYKSALSYILQYHELLILEQFVKVIEPYTSSMVLMHDGLAIKSDLESNNIESLLIKSASNIGYIICVIEKPLECFDKTEMQSQVCWNPILNKDLTGHELSKLYQLTDRHINVRGEIHEYTGVVWSKINTTDLNKTLITRFDKLEKNTSDMCICATEKVRKNSKLNNFVNELLVNGRLKKFGLLPSNKECDFNELVVAFLSSNQIYVNKKSGIVIKENALDRLLEYIPELNKYKKEIEVYNRLEGMNETFIKFNDSLLSNSKKKLYGSYRVKCRIQ